MKGNSIIGVRSRALHRVQSGSSSRNRTWRGPYVTQRETGRERGKFLRLRRSTGNCRLIRNHRHGRLSTGMDGTRSQYHAYLHSICPVFPDSGESDV